MKGLRVHVNGVYDITLDAAALSGGTVRVDLSAYLVAGINTIHDNPAGRDGKATVLVNLE